MPPVPPECRRLEALVERALDGELSPDLAAFVETHRAACAMCRDRYEFQGRVRAALDAALAAERVPPGLAERIAAALAEEEAREVGA